MAESTTEPRRPILPEPGDLIYTPRDFVAMSIVDGIASTGHVIARGIDGSQLRKVPFDVIEAWFRPFWRRVHDVETVQLLTGPTVAEQDAAGVSPMQRLLAPAEKEAK